MKWLSDYPDDGPDSRYVSNDKIIISKTRVLSAIYTDMVSFQKCERIDRGKINT